MVKQYEADNNNNSRITQLEAQVIALQSQINRLQAGFDMLLDQVEAFPQVQADVNDLKCFKDDLKDAFRAVIN